MPKVAIYCRISLDVAGEALGVGRQEEDARALAERRGWDVGEVFVDNDFSAYKRKPRPAFEEMLRKLQAGLFDGLAAYDLDRLMRRNSDLERIIDLYDHRPLIFATVQGDIDLSTPDGRTMARVLVAFANKASMDTSRRVTRKHLELARTGVTVGGYRPFGLAKDKKTLDLIEARHIQEAAAAVLSGVGIHTVVRRWNEAGIKTTAGNPWKSTVLRTMLLSPRLAGYRVYKGGIARDEGGEPVMAHPPILDVATWESLVAYLKNPDRVARKIHTGGRKYLLSGLVRCGICGSKLRGNNSTSRNTFYYACPSPTSGGCGGVGVTGPALDMLIRDTIFTQAAERGIVERANAWPLEEELAAVLGRMSSLMDAHSSGTLSAEVVFPQVEKMERRVAELRAERQQWLRDNVGAAMQVDLPAQWEGYDMSQKQGAVASFLQAVFIQPGRRGPYFDHERVKPVWR